jgi:CRP-like cAMP-binding protein
MGALEGRVVDMTWRAVTLHTVDDNYVVIPNGTIAKQEIINYNAPDSATARMVRIGLECDLPPCDAIDVLQRAALETAGVNPTPPPLVVMLEYADSAIVYGIKFWITEPHRHLRVEHEVRLHIWYRLKERGYAIPSPIRTVEHVSLQSKQRRQLEQDLTLRQEILATVPLLQPLSSEQRRQLAEGAARVQLAPGQMLFMQDDPGDSFYVVHRGKADILIRTKDGAPSLIATLGPGDIVGEMSALTGQPRSATVRAAGPLSLVAIDKPDLQRVIDADPAILEKLSELIARRNLHRDEHLKSIRSDSDADQELKTHQQSLLGRMMSFFQKKPV